MAYHRRYAKSCAAALLFSFTLLANLALPESVLAKQTHGYNNHHNLKHISRLEQARSLHSNRQHNNDHHSQHWEKSQPSHLLPQMLHLAQKNKVSKQQAINIARSRVKGKVLSANLVRGKKRSHYRIKMLTEKGRVKTLNIDAGGD